MRAYSILATGYGSNRGLFRDPILILALLLLAIALFCKLTQGRELVPNRFIFSRSVLSNGSLAKEDPPINLGALGESNDHLGVLVRLDFESSDRSNYPNLLQTDSLNQGLRLELSGRTIALIAGSPSNGIPYQVFVLSETLSSHNWHNMVMRIVEGRYVDVKIDGMSVGTMKFDIPFSTRDVRVGIGFDDTRRFHGDIKNIDVLVGSSPLFGFWRAILDVRFHWFFGLFLVVFFQRYLAYYSPLRTDVRRLAALKREVRAVRLTTLLTSIIHLSILLNLAAILYSIAKRHFLQDSEIVMQTLLPGFERLNGAPPFNSTLVIFILIEMSLIGTLAIDWATTLLGGKRLNSLSRNIAAAAICILSAALFFVIAGPVPRLLLACATVLTLIPMVPWSRLANAFPNAPLLAVLALLRRTYNALQPVTAAIKCPKAATSLAILRHNSHLSLITGKGFSFAAAILLCSVLAWPVFQAWFPVVIPNDYMESADLFQIKTPSGTADIARNEVADCLRIIKSMRSGGDPSATRDPPDNFNCRGLDLPQSEWNHLENSVSATAGWQGETGRTLFHHAYIFVPAKHFLTYGFDRAVPYLYGYGNTILHAFLMRLDGGPTLSSYFSTFPIVEIAGIAAIALLVLLVTGSGWLAISGFAISLIAFYSIAYAPILLAASFSPARYLGLILQLASICLCCRNAGSPRHLLLQPIAAAASLFWNAEFALLGLVGQAMLAMAPGMKLTLTQRALLLVSLIASPLVYAFSFNASPDIIKTVQLSFFNIGMPFMSWTDSAWLLASLIAAELVLFCISMLFLENERTMRLCYLPVLALLMVKYIYNPAPPHLYLVYTLVWPMLLFYLPPLFSAAGPLVAAASVCFAAFAGNVYKVDAKAFRSLVVNDFAVNNWHSLGESVGFVAPEMPISERVESIKKQVMPGDTLIILSPYDQILNFYINPRTICGHFDILSNLATHDIESALLTCATRSSKTLIVYDKASETPCPTGYLQTQSRCALKAITKGNLTSFRDRLQPFVELVGSDENLLFYRPMSSVIQGKDTSINEWAAPITYTNNNLREPLPAS
jgi:hypothetical protein